MKLDYILVTFLLLSGCSGENTGQASSAKPEASASTKASKADSAAPTAKPAAPEKTGAPATASAAAPVDVKPATVPPNALGVTMTLKPGAMDGDSYKAKAEVLNKGSKEISNVFWAVCRYDATGKLQDGNTTNGENAALKPNDKTDIDVWVTPAPLVGFRITGVKYPDGSNKEADFAEKSCPDTIKP